MLGDIATTEDGEPQVHARVFAAKRGGAALGGHLRRRSLANTPIATIRLSES